MDPEASGLFPGSIRASGPVPAAAFLARISALYKVLEAPELYARRLARSLDRQRKRGGPKPHALPTASACRLRPELGLIATALPGLLSAALEGGIIQAESDRLVRQACRAFCGVCGRVRISTPRGYLRRQVSMDEWRHGCRGKGRSMDHCLRRGLR